ncbi:hypothetical protein GGS24DRAFT_515175 [Hypoxylon argillaceum]|nr:hypothetical protein GGS24DRAFT_515175 [Hypoxylon argillaceum]
MDSHSLDENEQGESLLPKIVDKRTIISGTSWSKLLCQWIGIACTVAISLGIGYLLGLGRLRERDTVHYGLPLPAGSLHTSWQHNLTFTQIPSPSSEAAWNSIIPIGRGFVHHSQLAPFISNIAVFHQLHCLHAVIVGYYDALARSPTTSPGDIPDFDNMTSTRIAPFHIRHCFDYLRQAIMCAADTNFEVLDRDTHLTNGWGQPKLCRDYEQIFAWAEQFANSSDTGIVT